MAILVVLAAAATAWAVLPRAPVATEVGTIANRMTRWEGVRVQVSGTLLRFQDPGKPPYGVVQGPSGARIGIRTLQPWAGLVNQRVRATGTVAFAPHFGLYLAHPTLRALAGGS